MGDRLLWTRRHKARDAALKAAGSLGPVALLVLLVLATGGRATAGAVGIVGGMVAVVIAGDVRTPRGALIGGAIIAIGLLALHIAIAWLIDHPILD